MFNPQNDVIVAVILVALIIDIKNHPLWTWATLSGPLWVCRMSKWQFL
jgi:hypothetical protein